MSQPREVLYAASSERRADEIGRALRQFAPAAEVLVLPPWDCLPYDRASPSREIMGRRFAVLGRLAEASDRQRFLIASVEALMLRTPPVEIIRDTRFSIRVGERLDIEGLEAFACSTGYIGDDRVDEPGEMAVQGEVIDIFPAAESRPHRLTIIDHVVAAIRPYDPLTQRTLGDASDLRLGPASEVILPASDARALGVEHHAAGVYDRLDVVLDLVAGAAVARDPKALARAASFEAQVSDAHAVRTQFSDGERPSAPDALYLTADQLCARLAEHPETPLQEGGVEAAPNFAVSRNPGRDLADFGRAQLEAGNRVLATGLAHEARLLARRLRRSLGRELVAADSLADVLEGAPGELYVGEFDLEAGFIDPGNRLAVIAASDVFGGRVATGSSGQPTRLLAEPELRIGDVVIHEDHGIGVLRDLETVELQGRRRDAVRLEYHGAASLLAPIEEFGKLWRYGSDENSVTLDRLHTDAWSRRRAEISREIDRTAAHLTELARLRATATVPVLNPPAAPFARFAARFPYPETPDQAVAIEAVLSDLGSGRPMNRLVCGDVGYGKTEVALRAVAAAAMAGKQVAVVAPTTVLARQHFLTFRKRFEGTGIEVAQLSRLVSTSDAKQVRDRLANGEVQVVVGTHALAAETLRFDDLGLVVIDEEQRFGGRIKSRLRALAPAAHVLTLTATPIPRTLQTALIGVEDVSVIATPPSRRRPVRTFVAPFDKATLRTALLRERRRGGQSFVVAPRIEEIGEVADLLTELAPELKVVVAHGDLPAEAVDEAMVKFADGEGDVLLATSIIESGLDVPRANTMLVWRADRFGLAQLHQLRGRVGRGRSQGFVYLFTEPDADLAEATRSRLSTLEAFDRLGAGLAISMRDLDIRGGGDLAGDDQAGHMKMIGLGLYQQLLERALRAAAGEADDTHWTPELNVGVSGLIPDTYVPETSVRISLYARLARLMDLDAVAQFADEVEDRFGPPPEEVVTLLDLARVSIRAREAGISRIDAGPKGVALTLTETSPLAGAEQENGVMKGDRLVLPPLAAGPTSAQGAEELLDRLSGDGA
jgi:transcription-repair coupling factor (superfamily II helicase)